jgi:hypothetical protein
VDQQPQPTSAAIEAEVRAELDRPGAAHFTRNEIRTVLAELDRARAALETARDDAFREAAATQRGALLEDGYDLACRCDGCTACLVRHAICAIDPDTDYYEDAE